jgi:hypothetical protein
MSYNQEIKSYRTADFASWTSPWPVVQSSLTAGTIIQLRKSKKIKTSNMKKEIFKIHQDGISKRNVCGRTLARLGCQRLLR